MEGEGTCVSPQKRRLHGLAAMWGQGWTSVTNRWGTGSILSRFEGCERWGTFKNQYRDIVAHVDYANVTVGILTQNSH